MTDIVELLCALARHEHDDLSIAGEAADEIERLTDALHDEIKLRQAARDEIERLRADLANAISDATSAIDVLHEQRRACGRERGADRVARLQGGQATEIRRSVFRREGVRVIRIAGSRLDPRARGRAMDRRRRGMGESRAGGEGEDVTPTNTNTRTAEGRRR